MADSPILTPGRTDFGPSAPSSGTSPNYLIKENLLGEFTEESEKSVARDNLGVYPKESLLTKEEIEIQTNTKIKEAIQNHLNTEDPHGTLKAIAEDLKEMVRKDGSVPFSSPQSQTAEPFKDEHLTTKKFVDKLIQEHSNKTGAYDPHKLLPEVEKLLVDYAKVSDVYDRDSTLTSNQIQDILKSYVKKDGSITFTAGQMGVDPTVDSHLTTKRYVDKLMQNHNIEVDPHGFISILNSRLAGYATKNNTYDKTQTYSRTQLDSIIHRAVQDSLQLAIENSVKSLEDKLEELRKQEFIKSDGTVPFHKPQRGIPAKEDNDLVTLKQVTDIVTSKVEAHNTEWITSGPVQTTVGFVEANTELAPKLTMQETLDAIFYGKAISITVDPVVKIGNTPPVTVCVRGSAQIKTAILILGDNIITNLTAENFKSGCVTLGSKPIYENTTFRFEVTFTNGSVHEAEAYVKIGLPIFFGLLPKWKTASTVTMKYLETMVQAEPNNNRFVNEGPDMTTVTQKYTFEDVGLRHIFAVVPKEYPKLSTMTNKAQSFDSKAFDIVDAIPLLVPAISGTQDVIYTMYVYRLALSNLDSEVTFNFKK